MRLDLYGLDFDQLTELLVAWGQPPYRARQIWDWLYRQLAPTPAAMTNLPPELRERLGGEEPISQLMLVARQRSADSETEKRLFRLPDGETIETVVMGYQERRTLCISSQVGCAMGCIFCATGQMGFRRHLAASEIVDQVLTFEREWRLKGSSLTNVVLMGMGEPLHNYDATVEAIRRLIDPDGFNLGVRRITVSTVGLVPQIRRLAAERLKVGLAISLHGATDQQRSRLVPAARRWPLAELLDAAQEYAERTGRRVSFEWALIRGENDSLEQAHALGRLLSGRLCHVNLIPLNPTGAYGGRASSPRQVKQFADTLASYGVPCTIRVRRGIDIQAGCGQLRQSLGRSELAGPGVGDEPPTVGQ